MKKLTLILFLISISTVLYSQDERGEQQIDTTNKIKTYVASNPKPAGIFIAPTLGFEFPLQEFADNSKYAISYGAKLEYASISIYPVVIFGQFQYQNHPGSDIFKTQNLLNSAETQITSYGGGVYFLLNKYLKSNFTMPFLVAGVKLYNVKRILSPDISIEGIKTTDSKVVFSAGLGFTLFIFGIITSYNFAKEYSTLSIMTQFRIPLIKF